MAKQHQQNLQGPLFHIDGQAADAQIEARLVEFGAAEPIPVKRGA
jgi:hypothetical protein